MSASILTSSLLSIDIIPVLSSMKLSTHLMMLASNPISSNLFVKYPFASWGKAPLTSYINTAVVLPIPHVASTLLINLPTTSTANLLLLLQKSLQ